MMGERLNRLAEAVLTCTHNLCFGVKIREIGIPLHTSDLLYKSGVQRTLHGHVFVMVSFHDNYQYAKKHSTLSKRII